MSSNTTNQQWEIILKRSKSLETRLETKLQRYITLCKIASDGDVESNSNSSSDNNNINSNTSYVSHKSIKDMSIDIDKDLNEFNDCISNMKNQGISKSNKESIVKRYQEVYHEYYNDFKNASYTYNTNNYHQDSISPDNNSTSALFGNGSGSSKTAANGMNDSLLRERNSIASSFQRIGEVMDQAINAKSSLINQQQILTSASSGLNGLTSIIPSFNRLIDGVRKKKTKDMAIVGLFCSALICFTVWYLFLR